MLTINGVRLHYRPEIKFLELTFDRQLTLIAHAVDFAHRYTYLLTAIYSISHMTWGAGRKALLRMYITLLLLKMDDRCALYSSARRLYLKKINPVHNAKVCNATGTLLPAQSLYCEAVMMSFHLRRELSSLTKKPLKPSVD